MTMATSDPGMAQAPASQATMNAPAAATKPNGPVDAGMIAAGLGAFVIGLGVVLNEASAAIKDAIGFDVNAFLKFDANYGLGKGVGPLSGKVTIAVLVFIAAWLVLGYIWRDREIPFQRAFWISLILVGLGFLLTFPPFFELFAAG